MLRKYLFLLIDDVYLLQFISIDGTCVSEFWHWWCLKQLQETKPKNNILVVVGKFNANIGKEEDNHVIMYNIIVIGNHIQHDKRQWNKIVQKSPSLEERNR